MASSNIASTTRKLYITLSNFTGEQYVDLAQCLSLVNRRAYRQGMNYAVDNIRIYATSGGNVNCSIVPTTWCADNATTRAFIAWSAQRKEVLDEQPSLKSRWSDFKIFMDSDHVTATVAANLLPNGTTALDGEWIPSEIVFPVTGGSGGTAAANQQTMHVVGDNLPVGNFQTLTGTSFSLVEAYANSRRTHEDPDPSTTGVSETTNPYATLSVPDSLFQDIAENLIDNNNSPPYPNDDYPGGATYLPALQIFAAANLNNIGDAAAYSTFNTGSFVAPFGLLKFDPVSFSPEAAIFLEITLVPGSYKGVLAEKGV